MEIGIPGTEDSLEFVPLETGAELRLQSFGQGGTHVFLAVRCVGFGSRAYIAMTLKNLVSGAEVTAPAPPRAQLLYCREDDPQVCDLVPVLVMAGGLSGPDEEADGLPIEITAEVENTSGQHARATERAVLSTADL